MPTGKVKKTGASKRDSKKAEVESMSITDETDADVEATPVEIIGKEESSASSQEDIPSELVIEEPVSEEETREDEEVKPKKKSRKGSGKDKNKNKVKEKNKDADKDKETDKEADLNTDKEGSLEEEGVTEKPHKKKSSKKPKVST